MADFRGLDAGKGCQVNTLTTPIAAFMRERKALGIYGPKSVRVVPSRLQSLSGHFGQRPLRQLTQPALVDWLESISHLSTNTRAVYLCSVRQFTGWATHTGLLERDPCQTIAALKRANTIPRAQPANNIAAIFDACADDRERAIIWLMVGLGLRRMEVAGLRWEHYDDRAELLHVTQAKNGNERVLPVVTPVARALHRIRTANSGPIIRSARDGHTGISVERVGQIASRVMLRSGVKHAPYDGVSGHALRHTAASDVLDECQDLRDVQVMLGHQDLSTTAIYLRKRSAHQLRNSMEGRGYQQAA